MKLRTVDGLIHRGRQQRRGQTARGRVTSAQVKRTRKDGVHSEWMETILKEQPEDKSLQKMKEWQERPAWEKVAAGEAELKIYWSRWNQIKKEEKGAWYYLCKLVGK